jgi:two-component system sensor histidine kinase YesM
MSPTTIENIYSRRTEESSNSTGFTNNGIGLHNIKERIQLYFGNEYGLEVTSEKDIYTRISLILPIP